MENILEGMAEILWASAWSDHVEETGCQNLSGCKITEMMPEVPECAITAALCIANRIQNANNCSLDGLFAAAMKADGGNIENMGEVTKADKELRFGNCLAFMSMGSGVSWFDDHAQFDLKVPEEMGEITCNIRFHADENCEECNE